MSQSSPQLCPQCRTPLIPGQRFCSNCGFSAEGFGSTQTASSQSFPPSPPTVQSVPPTFVSQATPPPSGMPPSTSYGGSSSSYGMDSNPYATPPPPPPIDPYSAAGSIQYTAPQPAKKRWPLIIIGIVLVVLLAACGGSYMAYNSMLKAFSPQNSTSTPCTGVLCDSNNSNGDNGANYAEKVDISNLTITYASDQISITSLQQAPKFSDDTYTSYSYKGKKNYVRLNFREKQENARYSSVYYRTGFRLILADKTVVAPENSAEFSGPEQGVERSNWIDFATAAKIDLNTLTLRVGGEDEATVEVQLKSGADVSKFAPKTINPNKNFKYATMDWTLTSATKSLYSAGKQAKNGKVYIVCELTANNNSNVKYYMSTSLARLKAGSDTIAPDYGSDTNDFFIIRENTTNLKGTLIFTIAEPADGKYTLQFDSIKNDDTGQTIPGPTVEFSFA